MSEYTNEVHLLFKSDDFKNMLNKFAENNKLSIESASNLLISYLLGTLVKVAEETKNIGLLDIIYLIYVDYSKYKFIKKYGNYSSKPKKKPSKSASHKPNTSHTKFANKSKNRITLPAQHMRRNVIKMLKKPPRRMRGGARKLVIRGGTVVEIDDSEEGAFEIFVPTAESLRRTGVAETNEEILREGRHMKVGILSLQSGDIVLSQISSHSDMKVSTQLAAPCNLGSFGPTSFGCSKIVEIDPVLEVALKEAESDPEMKYLVKDLLKQTLRNKAKAAAIENQQLELFKQEMQDVASLKQKKIINERKAQEIVKDVLENRGLTCSEIGQCTSGAFLEGTKYAVLVKLGIHLLNSGIEKVQETITSSLDKMSNSSDTLIEGAKAVKRTVSTLDWIGGKVFGGVNVVFDTVSQASESCGYKGPILRNGKIEYACLDSAPQQQIAPSGLRGHASDAAIQTELLAQAAAEAAAEAARSQLQAEIQAFEDNYGICDSSTKLLDLGDMCPRIAYINDSAFKEWIENMRENFEAQMMCELTSWPAYVFYIMFIYSLFHNIKEARAEKNRLRIHTAHGAIAHQTEVIREVKLDQNKKAESHETRSLLVRTGLAIATGGVSELIRQRSPKKTSEKSSSAIEFPESSEGVSGPVKQIANQIEASKSSVIPPNAIEDAIRDHETGIERFAIADVVHTPSSPKSPKTAKKSKSPESPKTKKKSKSPKSKGGTRRNSKK